MNTFCIKKITAIAALTIKQAVRSRILPILAIILPAVIILIVSTIKGDGTASGQIRMAIKYSLSLMWIIMGVATLWSGCASIAREVEEKQLRLIAVKPVTKYEIWFGRWLGWLAINTGLLTICGLTLTTSVYYTINKQNLSRATKEKLQNTILVGRHRITPLPDTIDDKIEPLLKRLKASGEIPADTTDEEACNVIQKRLTSIQSVVAPGAEKTWSMSIPNSISSKKQIALKLKLHSPNHTDKPISGMLTISTIPSSPRSHTPPLLQTNIEQQYDGIHLVKIPPDTFTDTENISITFKNNSADKSRTLVFTPGKSVELLINESSFISNLIRAMLIILCYLAVLSALGITSSAIFYFPVASFIAIAIIMAGITSHYFVFASDPAHTIEHHHHGHEHAEPEEPSLIVKSGEIILNKLQFVFEPTRQGNILQDISGGILISWKDTGRAIVILLLLYSGILGIIGSYILSKRELAALN